jgi:hypothetical protein
MSPCCGGSGAADILLKAKGALGMNALPDSNPTSQAPETVRLEYIGMNAGAISFVVNGASYRGGRNPLHRYIDARPGDVEALVLTGRWGRVIRAEAAPVAPPPPAPAPAPEPEPGPADALKAPPPADDFESEPGSDPESEDEGLYAVPVATVAKPAVKPAAAKPVAKPVAAKPKPAAKKGKR